MMSRLLLIIPILLFSYPLHAQRFQRMNVDSTGSVSFRGLSVVDDSVAWVSGTKGSVFRTTTGGRTWVSATSPVLGKSDYRSLYAFDSLQAVIANAGAPAFIYRTSDGGLSWLETYVNRDTAAFIDGVDFWDKSAGVMFGDPIGGRILLIRTTDGGRTWSDVPSDRRPTVVEGEYAFAASGTSLRCLEDGRLAIVTGGSRARVFLADRGMSSWRDVRTPMLQGLPTAGIFSFASISQNDFIVVGGDYQNMKLEKDHIFLTTDGGATWNAPRAGTRGYRECVERLDSVTVIATGPTGTDISRDLGMTWMPMSNEEGFHVVRKARNGTLTLIAGGSGKVSIVHR